MYPLRNCRRVLLVLLLFAPGDVAAERVVTTAYSIREGLAHFAVTRIVRDSRGFMWICTRQGLSMYDGYRFTTYRTNDGLPSSHVTDIVETPDGRYWVGTLEGLAIFDPAAPSEPSGGRASAGTFTKVPLPGDYRASIISSIVYDRKGVVWVGTNAGVFRIDQTSRDSVPTLIDLGIADRLNARRIRTLLLDRRGWLWIATERGLFVRRDDATAPSSAVVNHLDLTGMLEDRSGRIWGATTAGVRMISVGAAGAPRLDKPEQTLPDRDRWVQSLLQASDGSMWAATDGSLWRVHEERGQLRFAAVLDLSGQLITGSRALAEDLAGHLWAGRSISGVLRLRSAVFSSLSDTTGVKLAGSITRTAGGEVAFIGHRQGDWAIFCWDGRSVRAVKPGGPIGAATWAWNQALLQDSSGDWWLGTDSGVFRYSGARRCSDLDGRPPAARFDSGNGLASDVVIRLFEDSRGDVWMATVGHGVRPDGLSRWRRASGDVEKYGETNGLPTFERSYVSSFAEDRAGHVWIGFSGTAGLARFRQGTFELFTREHGLPPGQVRDLVVDRSGDLWIASFRGGVARVDDPAAASPRFRVYTTTDGLASNETYAIVPGGSGEVHVASAGGIDRWHPETGFDRRYTHADGLPVGEINAGLRDAQGMLWFTQTTGAVRLTTAERTGGNSPPRILITGLSVNGEWQPVSAVGQSALRRFSLSHDRNSLQVTFVALGSSSGPEYRYRYSLDTVAPQWSAFSEARTLTFANLAPAEYRLLIEARDADGRITDAPAVVEFTIVAPFWQQPAFIAVSVAIAMAAAYALHRYRLRQVLAITKVRDRIASDLHDDLGANLTKIAVLGEVARQPGARREPALTSIASIARESVANMSDIVWAIDPARDTLEDLVRKMRQHATETFALGDVALTFNAPRDLDHRAVDLELRHDLFLVFKEAINNAARHSRCRRAEVDLRIDRRSLRLRVSDDGVGFSGGAPGDGHGTGSMRARADRMGGALCIESAPGQGTTVTLALPLR